MERLENPASKLATQAEILAHYHHALGAMKTMSDLSVGGMSRTLYLPLFAGLIGAVGFELEREDGGQTVGARYGDEIVCRVFFADDGDDDEPFSAEAWGRFVFDLMIDLNRIYIAAISRRSAHDNNGDSSG